MIQERTKKDVTVKVKKKTFKDYKDRGSDDCCCRFKVFADGSNLEERNDISTFYIRKLSKFDVVTFELNKEGVLVQDLPPLAFNGIFGAFFTLNWFDVLTEHGAGCFSVETKLNGQVVESKNFELNVWSFFAVDKLPRLRCILNQFHQFENLDFSGLNLINDVRFIGNIHERKANPIINNLLYKSRIVKPVKHEYVYSYQLNSEVQSECVINEVEKLLLTSVRFKATDLSQKNINSEVVNLEMVLSKESANEIIYSGGSNLRKISAILQLYNQNDIARYV